MTTKYVHRIAVTDAAPSQLITRLLGELQNATIRSRTPLGEAVSFVVSSWRRDEAGDFLVQFSPLAAERLDPLSGVELLQSARRMVGATFALPEALPDMALLQ